MDASDSYIDNGSVGTRTNTSNGYIQRISSVKECEFCELKHVLVYPSFYELERLILVYSWGVCIWEKIVSVMFFTVKAL
ncbi:MAG: hypothetical protein J7L47_10590 [Candidatus Odinarchaeota archaeon]|nr:hypothetical protein [Candidatus Odinarchaeota archaeon]